MKKTKAMKFDDGKPPIDLIDKGIILELAKVLGYGAKKYEAHNWKHGLPISRYYSALQRHLLSFNAGETVDPESGLNHLGHAACNLMFMIYMLEHKPEFDDRPESDQFQVTKYTMEEIKQTFDKMMAKHHPPELPETPEFLKEDGFKL